MRWKCGLAEDVGAWSWYKVMVRSSTALLGGAACCWNRVQLELQVEEEVRHISIRPTEGKIAAASCPSLVHVGSEWKARSLCVDLRLL